ncbi:MAG: MFS transporter [Bacteroidaceae bacterium]
MKPTKASHKEEKTTYFPNTSPPLTPTQKESEGALLFTRSYTCILAANFLLNFGFWLLIPILPFYLKDTFGCTESIIGLVLCCYTVSALLMRPFSGFLLDSFARKPLYILSYFLFTTVFVGYVFAATLTIFIMMRVFHGLAFGTVSVGGNTVVVDIMPSKRRGEGLGYYGLANNVAMSTGPMVGLFLYEVVSFNVIFITAFISCIIGFICAWAVSAPRKEKAVRSVLSLDRFILLKGVPASISLLLLSIPYGATTNFVAMYSKSIGLDVPTGFFFTFMAIGIGVSRIFAGKLVDKGRITQTISQGFYLLIAAFFLLSCCEYMICWNKTLCIVVFFLVPFMQGLGFGTMFPAYNSLYINLAPHNRRATATSTYLTAWDVGMGIGILMGGLIAQLFSFGRIYLVGGFLCIVSMLYFRQIVTPHYHKNKLR